MERVEDTEILATGYGGSGPDGMKWRVVRTLPMRRIFRIDFVVTDGRADPQLTELRRDWKLGDDPFEA